MEINLNQIVKVRLTDFGVDILRKRHYMLQEKIKERVPNHNIEPFKLKLNPDGSYNTQLWTLMEQFGNCIRLDGKTPFETTIIVEE